MPKPAIATAATAAFRRRVVRPGQGAARAATQTAATTSASWSNDHTRYAEVVSRRLAGEASTAASGGFSNGM